MHWDGYGMGSVLVMKLFIPIHAIREPSGYSDLLNCVLDEEADNFQTLAGYDEDSTLSIDLLLSLKTCNGRIGATGMCLGGHLAYRCALDPRVSAAVTYFATDLHSATLGLGKKDDSLSRAGEIKAELAMIHGTLDNHVPPEGRDLIRKTLRDKGVIFSWYEPAGAQRESSI
jgi:carboxymethylenebutenolidase